MALLPLSPGRRRWAKWGLVGAVLAAGLVTCTEWGAREFRKMLAFTTVDPAEVLPQAPDRSRATVRHTVSAKRVFSMSCPDGQTVCTRPQIEAERLPRSVTFEFPTAIVFGVGRDNGPISLRLWHRSMGAKPLEAPDAGAGEGSGGAAPKERMIFAKVGSYFTDSWLDHISKRFVRPPCIQKSIGPGRTVVTHPPEYNYDDRGRAKYQCRSIDSKNDSYGLLIYNNDGLLVSYALCGTGSSTCMAILVFENWAVEVDTPEEIRDEIPEIFTRLRVLLENSVVARSYPKPDGGRQP